MALPGEEAVLEVETYKDEKALLRDSLSFAAGSQHNGPVRFSYNPSFSTIFSTETVFFSHNKSAETIFQLIFLAKRTSPLCG